MLKIKATKTQKLHPLMLLVVLITLLFCFNQKTYAQQNEISEVKFTFRHSLRIPNHYVTIEFKKIEDCVEVHTISKPLGGHELQWKSSKCDFSFYISNAKFDDIINQIEKINPTNIAAQKDFSGKDGTTCIIEFFQNKNITTYKIWTPTFDTKKRKLESFLKTCKLLLKSGGLKPSEIL